MLGTEAHKTLLPLVVFALLFALVVPNASAASLASKEETASTGVPTVEDVTIEPSASVPASSAAETTASTGAIEVTAASAAAAPIGLRIEDTDSRITYTGQWVTGSSTGATAGTYHATRANGALASICINGTGFSIIACAGPKYGNVEIIVDGVSCGVISCYEATYNYQKMIFTLADLTDGIHHITLKATGTKLAASSDTLVVFDAFDVMPNDGSAVVYQGFTYAEENDSRLIYSRGWGRSTNPSCSSGGYMYTSITGAYMVTYFTGTEFVLYGRTGPASGNFEVFIDDVSQGLTSGYSAVPSQHAVLCVKTGLSDGLHRVVVVARGTKEAASTGTLVMLDAVVALNPDMKATLYSGYVKIEDDAPVIAYAGSWQHGSSESCSDGSFSACQQTGATLTAVFRGSSLTISGVRGPSYGMFEAYVDGVSKGLVDCYAATRAYDSPLLTISGLSSDTHVLTLKVLGTKSGSSTGATIIVDAFVLLTQSGTPRFDQAPMLNYMWSTYIVVDKSDFKLYWVKDGMLRSVYAIAHGKTSSPTPSAVWRVGAKYKTDPYGVYGPRKMRLYRQTPSGFVYTAYGIHGTNEPWVIGTQASHGCIRMYNSDVLKLWPEVPIGTMVVTRN